MKYIYLIPASARSLRITDKYGQPLHDVEAGRLSISL